MTGFKLNHCLAGWLVMGLVLLSGCTPHNVNDDIAVYQARLARVLDVSFADDSPAPIQPYPAREALLQNANPIDINLTRFYQLQQCELGNIIAQRNTALGKVQHFSQRLRYEQSLIGALRDCIHYVDTPGSDTSHADLKASMAQWLTLKTQDYPVHWSNMLLLSEETRAAFSRPNPQLLFSDSTDIAGQLSLYKELNSYRNADTALVTGIEPLLQSIGASRLPASIWQAQYTLAKQLPPLTTALAAPLNAVSCNSSTASDTASILRNVFYLFFIEKIQPVGGRINDFNYQFAPIAEEWLQSASLPDEFKHFVQTQQQHFDAYQQAMQAHISLWQDFLARCHLSPTAPTAQ